VFLYRLGQVDGEVAAQIALEHRFEHIHSKGLTEDRFPGLFVETGAALAKSG
jgi:hypothetical protein